MKDSEITRRFMGAMAFALCLFVTAGRAGAQKTNAGAADTFTFLHVTDINQKADGDDILQRVVTQKTGGAGLRPAFVVATGSLTAGGQQSEFQRVKAGADALKSAGIEFYAIPGNHDVRWSPEGKDGFVSAFGKLYQSFDRGGTHFILLDSTVLLEHWGHFDKAELEWLTKDVRRLRPDTPILLFVHHGIGRESPEKRPIDNEFEFWPIFQDRNLLAVFVGHGKENTTWTYNGVKMLMLKEFGQGAFHQITVTPLTITVERFAKTGTVKPDLVVKLPVRGHSARSVMLAGWNDPDVPFLARRRPVAELRPRGIEDNPEGETGEYRIDEGEWKPMNRDARDAWNGEFATKGISIGVHTATLRVTTSSGAVLERELIFEIERETNEAARQWAYNVAGPIQSSPLLYNDLVLVTSLDGRVTALAKQWRDQGGKRRWDFKTKGAITASPVVSGDTVYVGSTDHFIYALNAATGKQKWKFDTGSPVFGSAAIARGTVCVGGNGTIYGLDIATGKPRWTQTAGGFFQSRAATDGEAFYLGGWDNTLYALEADTGHPRWRARMGRDGAGKFAPPLSPAISSPCVAQGRVIAAANDGVLYALNARTGDPLWQIRAPQGGDVFGYSSPVTANGLTLYVAGLGDNGDVYAIEGATGKIVWREPIGQAIYDSSPRLAPDGKSLAILGVRGKMAVLETQAGRKLWGYELGPGNIFSSPEYDGSVVYTTTMENDVQALNAPKSAAKK